MAELQIGEVAHRCGVNLQTIRYYERRGLLPAPPRSAANYRLYPEDTPARVRFIRRAQRLGFTLREIDELLSLRAAPGVRCDQVRERAAAKARDIERRLRALRAMRRALLELVDQCAGEAPAASRCPILHALEGAE